MVLVTLSLLHKLFSKKSLPGACLTGVQFFKFSVFFNSAYKGSSTESELALDLRLVLANRRAFEVVDKGLLNKIGN